MSLGENYEETYEKASLINQQNDCTEVEFFANLINGKKKVLDIGCAEGVLCMLLAHRGHDVTGSDISNNFLNKVLVASKMCNENIKTIKCDIENTIKPFKNIKYDVIYLMDVIEHLRNPVEALVNIRKLITDDGQFFIHTPNVFTINKFLRYLIKPKKIVNNFNIIHDLHVVAYDLDSLNKLLNFVGFKITKHIPTNFSLPIVGKLNIFKYLWPSFNDTLLIECKKCEPIDTNKLIEEWNNEYNK